MLAGFKNWMARPFSSDMSALEWFLFLFMLVIFLGVQGMILRHIRGV